MGNTRSAPNTSNLQIRREPSGYKPVKSVTPTRMAGDSLGSKDRNREPIPRPTRKPKEEGRPRRDISEGFSSPPTRGVVKQINKRRPPRENEVRRPGFRRPEVVRRKEERNNPEDSNFSNMMERRREKNIARSDI